MSETQGHWSLSEGEVARLCHDLRQCLMAGLMLAELPDGHSLDPDTAHRMELIRLSLTKATALVDSAAAGTPPDPHVMDLSVVARASADVAAIGHNVELVDNSSGTALVLADEVLIQRAVDNMLDNATRATSNGGGVLVLVGTDDESAWVEVDDDGPGFGEISHGSGQGLAVISAATRAAGGRMDLSTGSGTGTKIRLVFPRQRPAETAADG